MNNTTPADIFQDILQRNTPVAVAWIRGNEDNPRLGGSVKFFKTPYEGMLVEAEIFGLPNITTPGSSNFYAMHIHENGNCTPPFDLAGETLQPDATASSTAYRRYGCLNGKSGLCVDCFL